MAQITCPDCGEDRIARVVIVTGTCEIAAFGADPADDEYSGDTEIDWDSTRDAGNGAPLLACVVCGHQFPDPRA